MIVDENQETDVWWGGYAGRTMVPSFLFCGLLTAFIAWGAWYLWDEHRAHPQLARYVAYGLAAIVWLVQLGRWIYKLLVFQYRLTTRRLLLDRAFRRPTCTEVELASIRSVHVVQRRFERLLRVGRVVVESADQSTPPLILEGVLQPQRIAAKIRRSIG